jgi:cytochrome c peroxidase
MISRVFFWFVLIFSCCHCLNDRQVSNTPLKDFEAPFYFGLFELPQDNPLTEEGVALGRILFYDTILSQDSTISCASCHQQAKAFTDGERLGIGIEGQVVDRNTMSLVNMLWSTPHKFWDGRAANLEEQALQPIKDPREHGMDIPEVLKRLNDHPDYPSRFRSAFGTKKIREEQIAKALAQFQRTLISNDSKYDKFLRGEVQLSDSEQRGLQAFFTHPDPSVSLRGSNCGDCHRNFLTDGFNDALDGFANNGLDYEDDLEDGLCAVTGNPMDKGKFKIPSLRNIALTAPYMHDGRFNTLEEVIDHYNEHIRESSTLDILIREASNEPRKPGDPIHLKLTDQEKEDILAFLLTLTDSTFITNEKFSNPFID